ncbi:hypothetical protein ACS0TY_021721 [Phlomoides rotata]
MIALCERSNEPYVCGETIIRCAFISPFFNLEGNILQIFDAPRKGLEHDIFTYNTMIHGLLSKGRYDDGLKLFNEMKARESGEIPKAISFLHTMEDEGFIPNIVTYGTLIKGLCRDGEHEIAKYLFNELPSKGLQPDVQIYTIIVGSPCQKGMWRTQKC